VSDLNVREHLAKRMNDMTLDKGTRDHIRELFRLPPTEGFLLQMKQDLNDAINKDEDAAVMFLVGVKKLIEDNDSRVLDQQSKSETFNELVSSALMMATFYQTIPPRDLFVGVYHHYKLSQSQPS